MSRKEILQKDLQAVLAKDIVTKNPIFTNEHIVELHALFSLYADPRQRRVDIKDIVMTARTLGLDEKYDLVFRVLVELSESSGDAVNFEEFLKALTARIVILNFMSGKSFQRVRKRSQLQPLWPSRKRRTHHWWTEIHQQPIQIRIHRWTALGNHSRCWRLQRWNYYLWKVQQVHSKKTHSQKNCFLILPILFILLSVC